MTEPAIYSLTLFQGQQKTTPDHQCSGMTAAEIVASVALKDGLCVLTEKARAVHFVTCDLVNAPYIGETAKRFPPGAAGKQRSSSHCIESAWWAFDLDDITAEGKEHILGTLDGLTYCAYATHSNGREPGKLRMRVLAFGDAVLPSAEWTACWHVINNKLLGGMADTATARLYQCAGVWVAHPDRVAQSFRHVGRGQPFKTDELLALAPKPTLRRTPFISREVVAGNGSQAARYTDALRQLDAGCDHATWISVCKSLQAAVELGDISDADGVRLFTRWSATAPTDRQSRNVQSQYDPAMIWARKTPLSAPAEMLRGSLFKKAKEAAIQAYMAYPRGSRDPRHQRAKQYLHIHHYQTYRQLKVTQ